jgi:two-component system response regulator YesN
MHPDEQVNDKAFDYYASLNKIRTHVENNYSRPISLSDAAQLVGLEPKHFSKSFHQRVGIGFKQWLTSFRVQKAMECIARGDQSLTEIALMVGFEDFRTFERAFKGHTGVTPREFRAKVIGYIQDID